MYCMNGRQLTSNFTRLWQKKISKVDGKAPILIKQSVKNKELNLSLHPIDFCSVSFTSAVLTKWFAVVNDEFERDLNIFYPFFNISCILTKRLHDSSFLDTIT